MSKHPFTNEQLQNMIDGNMPEGWSVAVDEYIAGNSRWAIQRSMVVFNTDGFVSYYRLDWSRGATEYQEDDEDIYVTRVYPHEVTTIEYRTTP